MTLRWAGVARYGGVGDNLVASSVFRSLREEYGRLEVITQRPQHVVFENNPYVDKLSVYDAGAISPDPMVWKSWHDVRAKEYAFFVNLSHSMETFRAFLPGQTQFSWPVGWRRRHAGVGYVETVADICGVDSAGCIPQFFPTPEEVERAEETLAGVGRPVIGWVLSGTRVDKIYPASTLAVARLLREVGAAVVLFGAPGRDRDMAKRIQDHVLRQNGTLEGLHAACDEGFEDQKWPIRRVLATLQRCDLVVTPDTGPAWAVAACEVPKIVTLSHASPENITKDWLNTVTLHADPAKVPCWPCHQLHDSLNTCTPDETKQAAACISSISVQAIVDHAAGALRAKVVRRHITPEMVAALSAEVIPAAAVAPTPLRTRPNGVDAQAPR